MGLLDVSSKAVPDSYVAALHKWGPLAAPEAHKYHVPDGATLLARIIKGESNFNPHSVSSAGARGAGQFMPATRAEFLAKYHVDAWSTNPDQAVHAVALFVRDKGFAAYNPGGGQAYINYILKQDIGSRQGLGDAAVSTVTGAVSDVFHGLTDWADAIIKFVSTVVSFHGLGTLLANVFAWWWKVIWKAVWSILIAPLWHWNERAVMNYAQENILKPRHGLSRESIITMGFWSMGWAILFAKFEDGVGLAPSARDSALARAVRTGSNTVASRRLTPPKKVKEQTSDTPEATDSEVPLDRVRTVATRRKRPVQVATGNGQPSPENSPDAEADRDAA